MKRLVAEALGTFVLVAGGCGSAVLSAAFPELGIGFMGVALAFGLSVLVMAYAVGHISGGHFTRPSPWDWWQADVFRRHKLFLTSSPSWWAASPLAGCSI